MARAKAKPKPGAAPPKAAAANGVAGEVLTLAEAAAYLRLPEAEVVALVGAQALPARRTGGEWRFLKEAIRDWLRTPPKTPDKEGFWERQFGALKDDPYLEDMLEEIYRRRGRPMTEEG